MPKRLGVDTITLRIPTLTTGARGDRIYTYADGAVVKHCNFQPFLMTEKFQEEFTIERESSRSFFRVYLPVNADTLAITDKYRLKFDGVEYEVHAQPGHWRDFDGQDNHLSFLVKRIT